MPNELAPLANWLNTSAAAEFLGVHPTTIRRWSDQGKLPAMITPGGHRRFSIADLRHFEQVRRSRADDPSLQHNWANRALVFTRQEIASARQADWLAAYTDQARQEQRDLGRRMIGLIMRYISDEHASESLLNEAREIGRQHAQTAQEMGLSLSDATAASLFFRDMVIETAFGLSEGSRTAAGASRALFSRLTKLLNAYQLSVVETYSYRESGGDGT